MLSAAELETYLHREIPLARAMGIRVAQSDDQTVQLKAPLAENRNGHGTAFGGAIASLATLSCWSLLYSVLTDIPMASQLVVGKATVDYLAPIDDAFSAVANLPADYSATRINDRLQRGRRSRITLQSEVHAQLTLCATLNGEFAVLPRNTARS